MSVHYHVHKSSPLVPAVCQVNQFALRHPISSRFISNTTFTSTLSHFLQISPSNFCTHLCSCPYGPNAEPISFSLICLPYKYSIRIANRDAPHYAVFSTPLLPRSCSAQVSPSAPYSRKHPQPLFHSQHK
jgi:hypothetical protein